MDLTTETMAQDLVIPDELIRAYEATDYIVETPQGDVHVRVGQRLDVGSPLQLNGKHLAVITAWNPFSRTLEVGENEQRQIELIAAIETAKKAWRPARGVDPSGQWPPEPSVAVFDATNAELDDWMEAFGQNAVVIIADETAASLRLHPRATRPIDLASSSAAADTTHLPIAPLDGFNGRLRTALESRIKASLQTVALPFSDELGVVVDVGHTDTGSFFDEHLTEEVATMSEGLAAIDARVEAAVGLFVSTVDMVEVGIRDGYFIDDGGGTYLIAQIVSKAAEPLGDRIVPVTGISVTWFPGKATLEQHDWIDCQEWDDIFLNL